MKRLRLAFALLACLLLAACGGVSHRLPAHAMTRQALSAAPVVAPAAITPAQSALGHPCAPSDFYMQCALTAPAATLAPQTAAPSTYGVDFGWSSVSAARAKALGARFGASYLSADRSKNWTAASITAYHAAGLATVAVWETWATRATGGRLAGIADAQAARAQAAALGNTTRPIDFAIDCPCSGPSVLAYFQGARSVVGGRVDAYGDYDALAYLHAHGAVGSENWQTYAWSAGRWLPSSIAPLQQYLNGSTFDNDRALMPAYGQWPAPAMPAVLVACFHHRLSAAKCRAARARVASDQRAVAASQRAYDSSGCVVLAQRVRWFSTHLHLPYASAGWGDIRNFILRLRRETALAQSRAAYRQRSCSLFAQRVRYFTAAAERVKAAN